MNDQSFWLNVAQKITEYFGKNFAVRTVTPVSGGDINQAFQITDSDQAFFIKLNRASLVDMFSAELLALERLQQSSTIRVPNAYFVGQNEDKSFILMEYLTFSSSGSKQQFAIDLAKMHQVNSEQYGWQSDNFIGSSLQYNQYTMYWPEFYAEYRLKPQINWLSQKGCSKKLTDLIDAVIVNIDGFFVDYQPKVSLLHGDLWSGNYGFLSDGTPIIYDPASYFGDHEADLAMMELFGSPGKDFFTAYHQEFPIDSGYAVRKKLYNLYHILNHANLFGGAYSSQAASMATSLLSALR